MIDWRDMSTGHTAMSRTVGYTASIGAQMIADGQIRERGLLSPLSDVPYETFVRELARRDIQITSECIGLSCQDLTHQQNPQKVGRVS
jgi:saccharopine dehydrogenase-like NADP-dependent oxidoreductase